MDQKAKRKPYERPTVTPVTFPTIAPSSADDVQPAVALIVALQALEDIRDALDSDCDETGVALYNTRYTVKKIRDALERVDQKLTPAQREVTR